MARINGVDLPREKRVEIGLTYMYTVSVEQVPTKFLKKQTLILTHVLEI